MRTYRMKAECITAGGYDTDKIITERQLESSEKSRKANVNIDALINRRAFEYRADGSEKLELGRTRKSETNEFGQATIAQGEGLYDGLNLPFDPADLRTESGENLIKYSRRTAQARLG